MERRGSGEATAEALAEPGRTGRASGPHRRLGRVASLVEERRAEILALAYGLGGLGVLSAWAVDPAGVLNAWAVGVPVALALAGSIGAIAFRHHLPRHTEDAAVVASLGLVAVAVLYLATPSLLTPYFVWVGFASPLWFPTRRSLVYLGLTAVACGADAAVLGTRAAVATWCVTMATVLLAFLAVHFLSRLLVASERLTAVGEMASAVGHELRNPLGTITNALYLVRTTLGEPLDPQVERQLQLAERETARAVGITDDLRAFVRPRRVVALPVDVRSVVDDVLEATPPPDGVAVQLDLRPVALVADYGHLTEVLTNLVENAYAAMPHGGTLGVAVVEDHGRVVLTVSDTGVGMDEAVAGRVFEPFFTTRPQGTGLGLAIVQRLVEEHGGTVAVQSTPGRGTRLAVRLPRVPPSAAAGVGTPEWPH